MNEKIKELAEQAFDQASYNDAANITAYSERFAELLIQKCANIALSYSNASSFYSYDELSDYDRGCDDTAALISSRIKDVFKH